MQTKHLALVAGAALTLFSLGAQSARAGTGGGSWPGFAYVMFSSCQPVPGMTGPYALTACQGLLTEPTPFILAADVGGSGGEPLDTDCTPSGCFSIAGSGWSSEDKFLLRASDCLQLDNVYGYAMKSSEPWLCTAVAD
jgi:hypothetical protein